MIIGKISPQPYVYHTFNKAQHPRLKTLKFSFKDKTKLRYIVDVELYCHNLYALKFYVQKHQQSPLKFCKMTNRKCARSIIHTCIQIGIDLWEKDKLASFCFIGAPTIEEYSDNGYNNTKRFRAYGRSARFLLSPDTFDHNQNVEKSSYFLINKKAKEANPDIMNDILKMFENNYVMESLYPDLSSSQSTSLSGSVSRRDKRKKN
jgi:hypothetical protein